MKKIVSIPYGTIKRLPRLVESLRVIVFQFLMVRLKVMSTRLNSVLSMVSIPYGTIKRCSRWGFYGKNRVSIPYGTIKRMAKLQNKWNIEQVSIPYGTIKSDCSFAACVRDCVSIPYGTIKSNITLGQSLKEPSFNSLWYD